jgi:hypothetical protein
MTDDVMAVLRDLRSEDAARVGELFPPERRVEVLEDVMSAGSPATPRGGAPARRVRGWLPRLAGARRPVLLGMLGALAAAVIAAVLAVGSAVEPQPAQAGVAFRATSSGDIIALVTNPFATASQLRAAFAARGFDITVNLVPASPSLVGTAVYISDAGGASSIQPLEGGRCTTPGGACPIGFRIPRTFKGQGYITLGRRAKAGEQYESAGEATAPGEAMHGIRFAGRTVATVLAQLRRRHVTVPQYRWEKGNDSKALGPDQVPMSWRVTGAIPWAAGQVLLFVGPVAKSP